MADSDSSSLSSAPSTDDEAMEQLMSRPTGINRYFKPLSKDDADAQPTPPPPPPRRSPSPPHEYVLADNEAIAFLVMFRSRFHEAFPKSLSHYGPQDIENGVSGEVPDEQVERLLCALLGLVLNRKKEVERGHYGRALEEAIASNHNQWPTAWNGANPLHGGKSFSTMSPEERLVLLKTLVLWALNSSDVVQALIKESYKQTRRDDDKNQPRSVQPWFSDSYRRRYWLIEGLEDSRFRIYRENDGRTAKSNTWFSVAGAVDEVNALADKFAAEATANSKINSDKLRSAIPRFEAGEVKRQRKEYRVARKAAFARPEPGFSLYEGRTRGKRMKYTFSEGEEDETTDFSTRRSTRNPTPHNSLPTVTASGRQVKSRLGRLYGDDSPPSDQQQAAEQESAGLDNADTLPKLTAAGRPMRGAARPKRPAAGGGGGGGGASSSREGFEHGGDSDSEEHHSDGQEWSGNEDESDKDSEPDFDQDDVDEDDDDDVDDDDEMTDQDLDVDDLQDEGGTQESLVVQLRYRKAKTPIGDESHPSAAAAAAASTTTTTTHTTTATIAGSDAVPRETVPNGVGHGPTTEHRDLTLSSVQPQPLVQQAIPNGLGAGSGAGAGAGAGANVSAGVVGENNNGMDLDRYARPQMQVDVL